MAFPTATHEVDDAQETPFNTAVPLGGAARACTLHSLPFQRSASAAVDSTMPSNAI
jgi:hypothetical protein